MNTGRVIRLYPELEEWKNVFRLFNATGIFCNEFTYSMGFDTCLGDLVGLRCPMNTGIDNDELTEEDVITIEPTE